MEHNVSIKLKHELNSKKLEHFLVYNKQEMWYNPEVNVFPKPSLDGRIKILILYYTP